MIERRTEGSNDQSEDAGYSPRVAVAAAGYHGQKYVANSERPMILSTDQGIRRPRVAFCIDNLQIGGTELNAVRTAERLRDSRFDLSVICLQDQGPLLKRYTDLGLDVVSFPIPNLYGREALGQGVRMAGYLRRTGVEIFHAHDLYSNIFGCLWARIAGTPVVIASRRWWSGPPRHLHWLANRCGYALANCVLANSPRVGRMLVEREGVAPGAVAVVPNFVEEEAFERVDETQRAGWLRRLGVPSGAQVIGTVANLRPVKNHDSLVRALAPLVRNWPDLHLVLIGDGITREPLKRTAKELGVRDHTHFAGLQPSRPNPHQLFDISVLPSLSEGFPNTIIEAMAAGVSVVATDVGGTSDAVIDGVTGTLVPPRNTEQLADAIAKLLADEHLRLRMGENARRQARDRYSPETAMARLENLYLNLLKRRGTQPLYAKERLSRSVARE